MRLGIVKMCGYHENNSPGDAMRKLVALARHTEEAGLDGFWATDSFARGRPTLEPISVLAAAAAVTTKVELGTAILQVPVREPVELAHRLQTLDVLSGGRLSVGLGAGSSKGDFEAVGGDFEARFRTFEANLDAMRRAWKGEPIHQAGLNPWPGYEKGPKVIVGAWRTPRSITRAAKEFDGWMGSGLFSDWTHLDEGIKIYRDAGGKRALIANVYVDLRAEPHITPSVEKAKIKLVCPPQEARERLKRLADAGFDDVILISHDESPQHLAAIRDLWP